MVFHSFPSIITFKEKTEFLPESILSHSALLIALSEVEGPVEGVKMTGEKIQFFARP
jgi:hypothetical protein